MPTTTATTRPTATATAAGNGSAGSAGPSWEVLGRVGVESAERRAGGCARPVRLVGEKSVVNTSTGEVGDHYTSADELDGITYLKCGNRRVQACPTCSASTSPMPGTCCCVAWPAARASPPPWAIMRARSRRSPRPRSGPCTGSATKGPCRARRDKPVCAHGRPAWCSKRHHDDDKTLGSVVPGLLRLHRARGLAVARPRAVAPVHHHLATRPRPALRPVGETVPGPAADLLLQGGRVPGPRRRSTCTSRSGSDGPDGPDGPAHGAGPGHRGVGGRGDLRGRQGHPRCSVGGRHRPPAALGPPGRHPLDHRHRRTAIPTVGPGWCIPNRSPPTSPSTSPRPPRTSGSRPGSTPPQHARLVGASAHVVRIIETAQRVAAENDGYSRLVACLTTLGYRGHPITKSRTYSVTFGQIRRARRRFRQNPAGLDPKADIRQLLDTDDDLPDGFELDFHLGVRRPGLPRPRPGRGRRHRRHDGPLAMSGELITRQPLKEEVMEVSEASYGVPLQELWTVEQVSAFLHVPIGTLYQWRHQECRSTGLPPGSGCCTTRPTSGGGSSRKWRDRPCPLPRESGATRSAGAPGGVTTAESSTRSRFGGRSTPSGS